MALPATEDFTGTDAVALDTLTNWTQNRGAMEILTNSLIGTATGSHHCYHWDADSFSANQYSQVVIVQFDVADWIGPTVRCSTTAAVETFYLFDTRGNGDSYLIRYNAGSFTQLENASDGTRATNDLLRLEVTGSTEAVMDSLINGSASAVPQHTDNGASEILSGAAGVGGYDGSATMRGDTWEGGNLVGVTVLQTTNYQGMNKMNGGMRS